MMNAEKSGLYAVVEFTEEGEVEVVPTKWLHEKKTKSYWPPWKSAKTQAAVRARMSPTNEYTAYRVRVLYETESYEKARLKLKQAEVTSDLQTEAEDEISQPKRKKRPNPRYESDSSSEENELRTMTSPRKKSTGSGHYYPSPPRLPSPPTPAIRTSPRKKSASSGHNHPNLPPLPSPPTAIRTSPRRKSTGSGNSFTSIPQPMSPPTPARSPVRHPSAAELSASKKHNSASRTPGTCATSLFDSMSKPKVSALDTKVLTGIEELKQQVKINTQYLQAILKKIETGQASIVDSTATELPDNVVLPLKTKEEVLDLDEKLKDANLQRQLVSHLALLGGDSVKSCVRRVLDYLFTKAAALSFNWVGRNKNKIGFQTLIMSVTVKKAVRKNRLFSNATDQEIESVAKDFFRFAKDRCGGRKERKIVKATNATSAPEKETAVSESDTD